MKNYIKDGLQIVVAVILTGSMIASAAPLETNYATQEPVEASQVTETSIAPTEPEKPSEQPAVQPEPINQEPIIDPNNCEPEQYWAKEPPYECIPKKQQVSSATTAGTSNQVVSAVMPSGGRVDWLVASGIPENEWWAVDYLVSRESGWNPCAYYPRQNDCSASPSTACGLVQQNPCGKIPGDWTDPVAALKWQYQYVAARYGGYAQAVEHWKAYKSY